LDYRILFQLKNSNAVIAKSCRVFFFWIELSTFPLDFSGSDLLDTPLTVVAEWDYCYYPVWPLALHKYSTRYNRKRTQLGYEQNS